MIKTEKYNNISDALRKRYTLRPGKVAVFKLYNLVADPDPNNKYGVFLPASKHIQQVQTIWDPDAKDQVDICAIQSVTSEGVIKKYRMAFDKEQMGTMVLSGDNPDHQRIYTFMMLSNENETNKHRLKSVNPVFYHVDYEAEAKAKRKAREVRRIAMNAAYDMDDKSIRAMAAALDVNPRQDIDILRDSVETHADEKPVEFMRLLGNKNLGVQAIVNQAFRLNILRYLSSKMQVVWSETGQILHVVAPGKKPKQSMTDFLLSNTDSANAVLDSIRAALSAQGAELEDSFKSLLKLSKDVSVAASRQDDVVVEPAPVAPALIVSDPVVPEPVAIEPAVSKTAAKKTPSTSKTAAKKPAARKPRGRPTKKSS